MIKLTFHNGSESTTRTYDQEVVTIGYGSAEQVDLVLPDDSLNAEHVKIVQEPGRFFIYNSANDPFVALNGLPFAKQKLNSGDVLEIGKAKIYFEEQPPEPEEEVEPVQEQEAVEQETKPAPPTPEPVKKKVAKRAAQIIEEEESDGSPEVPVTNSESPTPAEPLTPDQRWTLLLRIVIPCLLLIFVTASFSYFKFSGKSERQEIRAAKGLADIGMALTYAQVNHLKPVQQHWANPEFLEEIFVEILGKGGCSSK